MSKEKVNFSETFQQLVNTSIEANKVFIHEGSRMLKAFTGKEKNARNFNIFQNKNVANAFNDYVDLNVKHFTNLIDLGLRFVKTINKDDNQAEEAAPDAESPSFILEKTVETGTQVSFQFLLDNSKPDTVQCQLIYSDFVRQEDNTSQSFKTDFSPQSFELKKNDSKPVSIIIFIPEDSIPGLYVSKVHVKGFEPAYFSIQLTITEKQKESTINVRKKTTEKNQK